MTNWAHRFTRLCRHRWSEGQVAQAFSGTALLALEQAIADSEAQHTGQVRLCIEGGLPYSYIWRNESAHTRALNLFGKLRVWDTEANNGVLIYLLLADHAIEIIADRAIARAVPAETWSEVVTQLQNAFQRQQYVQGTHTALDQVTRVLRMHFPRSDAFSAADSATPSSELPDAPVVMGRFSKGL